MTYFILGIIGSILCIIGNITCLIDELKKEKPDKNEIISNLDFIKLSFLVIIIALFGILYKFI